MEEIQIDEILDEAQMETSYLEEVSEILSELQPQLSMERGMKTGSGRVSESFFVFNKKGRYFWIVILCGRRTFAFKHITPEWVKIYSNLILSSPRVFVEYNINHYITDWAVEQDKVCKPGPKGDMVRAV